jgi:hypothetical protein
MPSKGEVKEPPGNDGQSDPRTKHQTWNQTEPSSSVTAARFFWGRLELSCAHPFPHTKHNTRIALRARTGAARLADIQTRI